MAIFRILFLEGKAQKVVSHTKCHSLCICFTCFRKTKIKPTFSSLLFKVVTLESFDRVCHWKYYPFTKYRLCIRFYFSNFHLRGQGGKFEQFLISTALPNKLQFFPSYLEAGVSQYLLHTSIPWPHVELHVLLSVQLP